MQNAQVFDLELDAIDWDAPTGFSPEEHDNETTADKNPRLYQFITEMAELIPEKIAWNRFTAAFHRYEGKRRR